MVQFSGLNEKFRNTGENTNDSKFKRNFLLNSIKCGNEGENCLYWTFEIRKFQNLGDNFEITVKNTFSEIIQDSIDINKNA